MLGNALSVTSPERDLPRLTVAATRAELADACATEGRAQLAKLACLARLEAAAVWADEDCRDMTQWVSINLGVSHHRARRLLHGARVLPGLPALTEALASGALNLEKTLELARFATPATETELIAWAKRVSVSAIKARGDRATVAPVADAQELARARHLTYTECDDGALSLYALLAPEQGAVVRRALERLAQRSEVVPGGDPIEARRADALVALAQASLSQDPDPERATLVVHAGLDCLTEATSNATAADAVIHPEVARRLACDARIQTVLHSRDGCPVGVGRTQRIVPRWLRRLLEHRDVARCTFPGCGARRFLHAHHVVEWYLGGRTDLDNLVLVCSYHHALVHEHRWRVELDGAQRARWFTPDGRLFVPGPAPPSVSWA